MFKKSVLFITAAVIVAGITSLFISVPSSVVDNTVMITRMDRRSGGSGVVISSSPTSSTVLTNGHVCTVAKAGGLVINSRGTFPVVGYKVSDSHDLCLITVSADLKAKAILADSAPNRYENATISGHPHLMPTVITKGHFSGTNIINVFAGMRPCTDVEKSDPNSEGFCMFFGGLPVIKQYQATLVTATIMAGSSGSAVYNNHSELAGLVFAGSGDLSYAYIVPYEYVANFLNNESKVLPFETPNYEMSIESLINIRVKIKKFCSENTENKVCKDFLSDMIVWKN